MQGVPSLRPYQAFNPNTDAETLRKAMKGLGCDKNKVIIVLCGRVNFQVSFCNRNFLFLILFKN